MVRIKDFAQLVDSSGLPKTGAGSDKLAQILTIAFTLIGAIAFLMLVITGFRYVLSQGDANKTAELRRQIIYLVFGLIIVASADIIVTYIVKRA